MNEQNYHEFPDEEQKYKYRKLIQQDIEKIARSVMNAQHEPKYDIIRKHLELLGYGATSKNAGLVRDYIINQKLKIDKQVKLLAFFRGYRTQVNNRDQVKIDEKLDQINELIADMRDVIDGNDELVSQLNYQVFGVNK